RIYGFTDMVAAANPGVEVVKAGYLGDHPLVLDTFAERATEILDGQTAMNCSMCKYRAQVLGFETEVGAPQESHHHHVEGQGANAPGSNVADCTLCESFCTGVCRLDQKNGHDHHHDHAHHHHHDGDHHHHHPPYPHADHPLGPESVRRHLKASG
ncbi:MAG: sirohydrochlorin chelatase, partial [Pseudomonadota bacterium]